MAPQRRRQRSSSSERDSTDLDFDSESPPPSTVLSSGYDSIIPEDLDLYDDSGTDQLTDEQMNALDSQLDIFLAAGHDERLKIVYDARREFYKACPGSLVDHEYMITLICHYLYGKIVPVEEESTFETSESAARARASEVEESEGWTVEESPEFVLTDGQLSIVEHLVPRFKAAPSSQRKQLIEKAADRIERRYGTEFDRDMLTSLICEHMYGKAKRKPKKTLYDTRKWTYLEVVTAMKSDEISILAAELSNDVPGSTSYFASYNKARSQVEKSLTDKQRQVYRERANEWSNKKLPPKMQRRMMEKHGSAAVKEFTLSVYKQFGMRVSILATYEDREKDLITTLYDFNDKRSSFKANHRNWRDYKMFEDYTNWSAKSFSRNPEDDDEPQKNKEVLEIKLKRDEYNYPILPSLAEINRHDLDYKKRLVGKFVSDVYAIYNNTGKIRVPWSKLERAREEYIEDRYMPEDDVVLKQYYHLVKDDVNAMLKHWTERQADGKLPLRFKHVPKPKTIRKKKRTEEESDTDSGMASEEAEDDAEVNMTSDEEAEDDRQHDNGRRVQVVRASQRDSGGNGSAERAHPHQSLVNAAENSSSPSRHSPDDGQGAALPSTTGVVHLQQQTGRGVALDSSHARRHPPRARCLRRPRQTNAASSDDDQSRSGPAVQEPSHNDKAQSASNERRQSQPGLPGAANEDQQPLPGLPSAADEDQQLPPGLNPNPSLHSPDDGQGAALPSTTGVVHLQQQTGGGVALDSSHARRHPPRARRLHRPHQTNLASSEDEQSGSGPAVQEPSHNDEAQSASNERRQSQPGLPSTANEDQQPLPGLPSAADEDEQLPPGSPRAACEGRQLPAALPSAENEHRPLPPASRSASPEIQRGGRRKRRENGVATADSPSSKRQKVQPRVDGTGVNIRRSNRDRRPTTKAADQR